VFVFEDRRDSSLWRRKEIRPERGGKETLYERVCEGKKRQECGGEKTDTGVCRRTVF